MFEYPTAQISRSSRISINVEARLRLVGLGPFPLPPDDRAGFLLRRPADSAEVERVVSELEYASMLTSVLVSVVALVALLVGAILDDLCCCGGRGVP